MHYHLLTATKVAGLTYRLLSTTTLIGILLLGIYEGVKKANKR
jgi:hypothetical protein